MRIDGLFDTPVDIPAESIRRDLAPFADPGTGVVVTRQGVGLVATWQMDGTPCEVRVLNPGEDDSPVQYRDRTWSYRSFFASDSLGHLTLLAHNILRSTQEGVLIQTRCQDEDFQESDAIASLRQELESLAPTNTTGRTRLVFVTADAGSGKTKVFEELVRRQARDYVEGRAQNLCLYINAQGRALATLEEAVAIELDDLKAKFGYSALATLVRLGLVVPLVDGFDELLATPGGGYAGGYDDPFHSLASFIEQLSNKGGMFASARSGFYEFEFLRRANESQNWTEAHLTLLPWNVQERREYVELRCIDADIDDESLILARQSEVEQVLANYDPYFGGKPLFVNAVTNLVMQRLAVPQGPDLLEQLVKGYLHREVTDKLRSKSGVSLLSADQLSEFYEVVAEEMWGSESRELDVSSLRFIAEYVAQTIMDVPTLGELLVSRAPTLAFLTPGVRDGSIQFEHESFFGFFLGRSLATHFPRESKHLAATLGRGNLPGDAAGRAAKTLMSKPSTHPEASELLRSLADLLGEACLWDQPRKALTRRNAGLLITALLGSVVVKWPAPVEHIRITAADFWESSFPDVELRDCQFVDVSMYKPDFTRLKLVSCFLVDSELTQALCLPGFTVLDFRVSELLDHIHGLCEQMPDGRQECHFDPREVVRLLRACGASGGDVGQHSIRERVNGEVLELIGRLVRAYARANPLAEGDSFASEIFNNRSWKQVRDILIDNKLIAAESRQTSGPEMTFYRRRFDPRTLLGDGGTSDERVGSMWSQLAAAFPASEPANE